MFVILLILLFLHMAASAGWLFVFKKLNINDVRLAVFIPFYGSFRRFAMTGKKRLFILYAVCRGLMMVSLIIAYCFYTVFIYISADQLTARPGVIISLILAYVFYLVCALCNYSVNGIIAGWFHKTKDDAVFMSFFPAVFVCVFARQASDYSGNRRQVSGFGKRIGRV